MDRKAVSGIMSTPLLISLLTLAFNLRPIGTSGTIYIRADGSIEPPSAPISTVNNVTYTFTDNINDSIVVERNNIIIDGGGYTLEGGGVGVGIKLSYRSNVTIKNANIQAFEDGIWLYHSSNSNRIYANNVTGNYCAIRLEGSSNNTICGNNITNNIYDGIRLYESSNNTLRNNDVNNNVCNFGIYGSLLSHYIQDIDETNTVNGKPVYYWISRRDMTAPLEAGWIALINCTRMTVKNLNLTSNKQGVLLAFTTNSTITKNNITDNNHGIYLWHSSNNSISGNNITNNRYGLLLFQSSNNTLIENNVTSNDHGITLEWSSNNRISGNNVTTNYDFGIELNHPNNNNTITGNNITKNGSGIWLETSNNTIIRRNTIGNNYLGIEMDVECLYTVISHNTISNNSQSIFLENDASHTTIASNIITRNGYWGIEVNSNDNTIVGNSISNNEGGIALWEGRSNTVSGNTITHNNKAGIDINWGASTNTVSGNIITNNSYGIQLGYSTNNNITTNAISNNSFGVTLSYSSNNIIVGNNITKNGASGIDIDWFSHNNTVINNTISSNVNEGIESDHHCHNNIILGNNIINNGGDGIFWMGDGSSNNTIIRQNTIRNNLGCGVSMDWDCFHNVIDQNVIVDNDAEGIFLEMEPGPGNSRITANVVISNGADGIFVGSRNNVIVSNSINNNLWGAGIKLSECTSNNTIHENTIANNTYGIACDNSNNNLIYHNNLINNTIQVYDYSWDDPYTPPSINTWDDGYPSGGNYWSHYNGNDTYSGPYQNETGSDGIGDTPYVIDENNQDNYPLMIPWGCPVSYESNTTITDATVTKSTLDFETSGPEGTIGYINVTMPIGFNTTAIKVFVDNVELTPPPFPVITTNSTHYFIYFEFNQSTHNITIQYAIVDIAINNVTLSKTVVGQGYFMNITVTVENRGNFTESFNVSVFYDDTAIILPDGKNHTTTTLTSGNSTTLNIPWNTTGTAKGNYTIKAKATPLPGETDTTDNTLTNGTILITIPGDVNGDREVNIVDIYTTILYYGAERCNERWHSSKGGLPNAEPCDIDCNDKVNIVDIYTAILHYGESW